MYQPLSSVFKLVLFLSVTVTYVSAVTVDVNYCGQDQQSIINIDPGACGQQISYQDVCGIMSQSPTSNCNLYTDLECQSQPVFSGHDFSGQNKGKIGSIRCT
ncbi:hypothetical protein BDC45DRAFT_519857 [Circinella umbellata]|nr:hypothetical protein BDC45DRAFT_519857 [Circinella umbellata]